MIFGELKDHRSSGLRSRQTGLQNIKDLRTTVSLIDQNGTGNVSICPAWKLHFLVLNG